MGSWNETCAITNLPIFSGQPVAFFLLTQVEKGFYDHGFSYSNTLWSPRALPVMAIYNDYGSVADVVDDWNADFILQCLKKTVIERNKNDNYNSNDYCRKNVKKKDINTIEDISELINDNCILVNEIQNQRIGAMMVHKWAYDLLSVETDEYWIRKINHEIALKDAKIMYSLLGESLEKQKNRMEKYKLTIDQYIWNFCEIYLRDEDSRNTFYGFAGNAPRGFGDNGQLIGIKTYKNLLMEKIVEGKQFDDPLVQDIFLQLSKYLIFRANFEIMRKTFSPQSGRGSQSEGLSIYKKMFTESLKFISARDEEVASWNEDWGDQ